MSIFAVFYCALSTLDALFTCFSCNKRVLWCSASWSRDSFHSMLGVCIDAGDSDRTTHVDIRRHL